MSQVPAITSTRCRWSFPRLSFPRRLLHRLTMLVVASVAAVVGQAGSAPEAAADQASRPNIVFIMADDLGWADVAFHGGIAPTPNLDRLADNGLELTQHYVAPVCSPTRTGLLTGRCWSRFGVTNPQNERALPWKTITLPRALKTIGYDTCLAGKWHLGSLPQQGPNHFGFDHSYGSLAGGVSPWNHRYKQGPFVRTWHRNETLLEEPGHVTDLIASEAISWIRGRSDAPFFLYVPFTAVHLPLKEPQAWLDRVPPQVTGDVARHYAASVMHLDDAVGRIMETLRERGLENSTLVVFTSDNGGSTAENNDLKYPDDNCPNGRLTGDNRPLRGQKGDLYEGGTRVPTIVSWPGHIRQGKVHSPVQITDWMPTFCDLAGCRLTTDLKWDGVSIRDLLIDQQPLPDRSLYAVAPGWRARSLRHGSWKLIVHGESDQPKKIELFNLSEDPAESTNRADQQPDRLQQMLLKLDQAASADRDALAKDDLELNWHQLPPLPDRQGFAGLFAGVSNGHLLAAGGANFPDRKPWEGGEKAWYDTVYALDRPDGEWQTVGRLPEPRGYGVSVTFNDAVVCVGGNDAQKHSAEAFLMRLTEGKPQFTKLPSLPVSAAYACGAVVGNNLYIAGGQERPDSTTALRRVFMLDLSRAVDRSQPVQEPGRSQWTELEPWPGPGRILAVAAAYDDAFWLIGGTSLAAAADGTAQRHYLRDAWRLRLPSTWQQLPNLPTAIVAAPSPAITSAGELLIPGGDDGTQLNEPPDSHRGFTARLVAWDSAAQQWYTRGSLPAAQVTAPLVHWNNQAVIVSGEVRPGVRSPNVHGLPIDD